LFRNIVGEHDRIWLVTSGIRPGESPNAVEQWLAVHAFKAADEWYDDFRLCLYASPGALQGFETVMDSDATLGESVLLESYRIGSTCAQAGETQGGGHAGPPLRHNTRAQAGDTLAVALTWQAQQGDLPDYTVFIHLISPDGALVAQRDGEPLGGFMPTSTWRVGEPINDRHALVLPADIEPGEYALWAGLYDTATGERLSVRLANGGTDDHVPLGTVEVEGP
jgi:hypothetical protein